MITGASDGIGKAISLELAKKGFKLVLVSRTKEKLEKVVKEISTTAKNDNVKYVVADFEFSHRNPEEFYQKLMAEFSNYEVSGLINNVGFLKFGYLHEQPLEHIESMLGINIYPQTLLSYYFLKKFVERFEKTKERSLLINLSSTADLFKFPTSSVYSATKRYDDFLSEGVRFEYSFAVDVATVKPGLVETNMSNSLVGSGLSVLPLTAEVNSYAKYLIDHLHRGINYGHWKHSFLIFFFNLLPTPINDFLIKITFPILQKFIIKEH